MQPRDGEQEVEASARWLRYLADRDRPTPVAVKSRRVRSVDYTLVSSNGHAPAFLAEPDGDRAWTVAVDRASQ